MAMMDFEAITQDAIRLSAAVVRAGGMATKSFVEDWLMAHHDGLSKVDARHITNQIEFNRLEWTGPAALADYPDVELTGRIGRAVVGLPGAKIIENNP